MGDSPRLIEFPITHAGVQEAQRFLSDEDDHHSYVLTLREISNPGIHIVFTMLENMLKCYSIFVEVHPDNPVYWRYERFTMFVHSVNSASRVHQISTNDQ